MVHWRKWIGLMLIYIERVTNDLRRGPIIACARYSPSMRAYTIVNAVISTASCALSEAHVQNSSIDTPHRHHPDRTQTLPTRYGLIGTGDNSYDREREIIQTPLPARTTGRSNSPPHPARHRGPPPPPSPHATAHVTVRAPDASLTCTPTRRHRSDRLRRARPGPS